MSHALVCLRRLGLGLGCLFESVVCGHHIYKEVWMPRTGEELLVES